MLGTLERCKLEIMLLSAKLTTDFIVEAAKFCKQYPNFEVAVRKTSDFHDRFIIIDKDRCWHIGASIKDAGSKVFMISEVEDERNRVALGQIYEQGWAGGEKIFN